MMLVPALTPVTVPPVPTVATAPLLLLHAPPEVASLSVVDEVAHTLNVPAIGTGVVFTVTVTVCLHPVAKAYVMIEVPNDTPVTVPDVPTVATLVLLLAQVPPAEASVRLMVEPTQTPVDPVITAGTGFTVNTLVFRQPVESAYVIMVVPGEIPHTVPVLPTLATPALLLAHVPPAVRSLRLEQDPTHTLSVPLISDGSGFTVTT
jgi:hypothetical protein